MFIIVGRDFRFERRHAKATVKTRTTLRTICPLLGGVSCESNRSFNIMGMDEEAAADEEEGNNDDDTKESSST